MNSYSRLHLCFRCLYVSDDTRTAYDSDTCRRGYPRRSIVVILAGVLLLQVSLDSIQDGNTFLFSQAGEEYARRAEVKELAKIEAETKAASIPQDKKDQ